MSGGSKATDRTKLYLVAALALSILLNIYSGLGDLKDRGLADRFPYLSKRIFVEKPSDVVINFNELRTQLRNYPGQSQVKLGVYFEYLPTGVSIGVNDRDEFFSASLIKIPVAMRATKMIEGGLLSKNEVFTIEEGDIDKVFGLLWQRGVGSKVTMEELIKLAITHSDGTAYNILGRVTKSHELIDTNTTKLIEDVYHYLDLPNETIGQTYGTSPKSYSSILKSLYFSAYLSYEDSNKLLDLMTQADFDKWLPNPIPQGTKVAHKYGLYGGKADELVVSSDCGIVYYPLRPYLLCVMVKSDDPAVVENHIRSISKTTYDFIDKISKK